MTSKFYRFLRRMRLPKLKISSRMIRLAGRFVDLEASGDAAFPGGRTIEYAFVLSRLLVKKPGRVLDVGCTSGVNSVAPTLAWLGWDVYGIDIRRFICKHPNFSFVQGDATSTIFPNDFFDHVYAASSIEHIGVARRYGIEKSDPDGDAKVMKEIRRILSPKGTLLITVPYGDRFTISWEEREYDALSISKLLRGYAILEELYYMRDSEGAFIPVLKEEASRQPRRPYAGTLALFELQPLKT